MTFFFGYLFEPFDVYVPEHKMNYFLICFIHALSPVIVLILFSFIKISLTIKDEWTIEKEILLIVVLLLFIGLTQFLIRDVLYMNSYNWSWYYLIEEIRNTFLVGTLFIFILMPLNFIRLNRKYIRKAKTINSFKTDKNSSGEVQISNAEIDFDVKNMLFAKAEGNYVELYFKDGNKTLDRITIKGLEAILRKEVFIVKTHRSYLVNINYIQNVSGNAQGYKIQLSHFSEKIPVSRNMIYAFNEKMNNS